MIAAKLQFRTTSFRATLWRAGRIEAHKINLSAGWLWFAIDFKVVELVRVGNEI